MKILFVCIRNTCRSVIAETIFNTVAKTWRAESAGIERAEKIDEKAKEILEREGYTVKKEKPRTIKDVNLEDYDLIIAVCSESCVALPVDTQWYIEDPAGKDEEAYRKAIDEIRRKVEELVSKLER